MREPVSRQVRRLSPPSLDDRKRVADGDKTQANHDAILTAWSCLSEIEVAPPAFAVERPQALTVAAWNMERCKHGSPSAALIQSVGADVVLATEMDHGMARSGQRHTTLDLAEELGFGYAFGVEFVELGTGDPRETAEYSGIENRHGLHGNAILSRYPLTDVHLIPISDDGFWYLDTPKNDGQRRIGARMAIAARVETVTGPLMLVAVHYESESDAAGRTTQTNVLLDRLDAIYGSGPAVIGGDLNTSGFLEAGMTGSAILSQADSIEPCFRAFAGAGFEWKGANSGGMTTRLHAYDPPDTPLKTLDWLLVRKVVAKTPHVVPALGNDGTVLSDHDLIAVEITP